MLPVLYQDDYMVAVHKPAGLLVHRSLIDKYETRFAMQMVRDQLNQHVFTVHRLDKPTSGVLLFALSSDVATTLNLMFAGGAGQQNLLCYCQRLLSAGRAHRACVEGKTRCHCR